VYPSTPAGSLLGLDGLDRLLGLEGLLELVELGLDVLLELVELGLDVLLILELLLELSSPQDVSVSIGPGPACIAALQYSPCVPPVGGVAAVPFE
jgi:hypothetical protein